MTYTELMEYAKKHYCQGGDSVYECWDENTFNEYVELFGEQYNYAGIIFKKKNGKCENVMIAQTKYECRHWLSSNTKSNHYSAVVDLRKNSIVMMGTGTPKGAKIYLASRPIKCEEIGLSFEKLLVLLLMKAD